MGLVLTLDMSVVLQIVDRSVRIESHVIVINRIVLVVFDDQPLCVIDRSYEDQLG